MNRLSRKGFTLAELLIVVAIIGILVSISIPVFTNQLERSRDAASIANIRSAYAQAMAEYLTNSFSDSRMDDAVHSYDVNNSSGTRVMTVNFRKGRIVQICVMNVEIKSTKANDWSGMGDSLPFHGHMRPWNDGDTGVPRKYMIVFNFDESGSGHSHDGGVDGSNWDGYAADGYVTSVDFV